MEWYLHSFRIRSTGVRYHPVVRYHPPRLQYVGWIEVYCLGEEEMEVVHSDRMLVGCGENGGSAPEL